MVGVDISIDSGGENEVEQILEIISMPVANTCSNRAL